MTSRPRKRRRKNPRREDHQVAEVGQFVQGSSNCTPAEDLRKFRRLVVQHFEFSKFAPFFDHTLARKARREGTAFKSFVSWGKKKKIEFLLLQLPGDFGMNVPCNYDPKRETRYKIIVATLESVVRGESAVILRKLFMKYTGEETYCGYSKLTLAKMITARFAGGHFAHLSRKEEANVVAEGVFDKMVQDLHIEMSGIDLPPEIIEEILSFIEHDYSLITGFGLCSWMCYIAVLSTWRVVRLRKEIVCDIPLVVLKSCRHLVVSRSASDPLLVGDWNYLFSEGRLGQKEILDGEPNVRVKLRSLEFEQPGSRCVPHQIRRSFEAWISRLSRNPPIFFPDLQRLFLGRRTFQYCWWQQAKKRPSCPNFLEIAPNLEELLGWPLELKVSSRCALRLRRIDCGCLKSWGPFMFSLASFEAPLEFVREFECYSKWITSSSGFWANGKRFLEGFQSTLSTLVMTIHEDSFLSRSTQLTSLQVGRLIDDIRQLTNLVTLQILFLKSNTALDSVGRLLWLPCLRFFSVEFSGSSDRLPLPADWSALLSLFASELATSQHLHFFQINFSSASLQFFEGVLHLDRNYPQSHGNTESQFGLASRCLIRVYDDLVSSEAMMERTETIQLTSVSRFGRLNFFARRFLPLVTSEDGERLFSEGRIEKILNLVSHLPFDENLEEKRYKTDGILYSKKKCLMVEED